MMRRATTAVVASLTLSSTVASAQIVAKDYLEMQNAMVAAQAAAVRLGDEALGCDTLHEELVSSMNSPALQAYVAKSNAAAAKQLAGEKPNAPMTADGSDPVSTHVVSAFRRTFHESPK